MRAAYRLRLAAHVLNGSTLAGIGVAPAGGATRPFTVRLRPETVLTAADVQRALESPLRLLVDARAAERFGEA